MAKSIVLAPDASRPASLLLSSMPVVCAFVAPRRPGASTAIIDRLGHSRTLSSDSRALRLLARGERFEQRAVLGDDPGPRVVLLGVSAPTLTELATQFRACDQLGQLGHERCGVAWGYELPVLAVDYCVGNAFQARSHDRQPTGGGLDGHDAETLDVAGHRDVQHHEDVTRAEQRE